MLNFIYNVGLISMVVLLCGCSIQSKKTATPLELVKAKRDLYIDSINDPYDLVGPCDSLTFIGLWDQAVQEERRVNIYRHEYEPGQWHRHPKPCYPDASRSEISTEGILGALRSLVARGDTTGIGDMVDYAETNGWVMGEGPEEYTYMPHLGGLMYDALDTAKLKEDEDAVVGVLKGYRGNVIADYIELRWFINDGVKPWHKKMIKNLRDTVPQNPIYQALYHCFEDGDQTVAVGILNDRDIFPPDRLPESPLALFDWSDAPAAILYIWTVSILERC